MALLLNTPRLRFQLIVGLLLALGTVPEGSEGKQLKCYVCNSGPCVDNNKHPANLCDEGDHCFNQTGPKSTDPKYAWCGPSRAAQCFQNQTMQYGNDTCHTFKTEHEYTWLLVAYCSNFYEHQHKKRTFNLTICQCDTDLCNPAGHPTSNKMGTLAIILLSLMIPAIYGGAAGSL